MQSRSNSGGIFATLKRWYRRFVHRSSKDVKALPKSQVQPSASPPEPTLPSVQAPAVVAGSSTGGDRANVQALDIASITICEPALRVPMEIAPVLNPETKTALGGAFTTSSARAENTESRTSVPPASMFPTNLETEGQKPPEHTEEPQLVQEEPTAEVVPEITTKTSGQDSTPSTQADTFVIPPSWKPLIQRLPQKEQEHFAETLQHMVSACSSVQGMSMAVPGKIVTSVVLEEFIQVAQTKHRKWEEKKWSLCIGGKPIIPRAIIEKIIDFARRFRDIGTIVMQYDPAHAALPWAGFALILQFAIAESDLLGQILVGLEDVARLVLDGIFYEKLYLSQDRPNSQASDRLQETLEKMYYYIVAYTITAIRVCDERRFLKSITQNEGLASKLQDVLNAETNLRKVVELVEAEVRKSTHEETIKELKNHLSEILHRPFIRSDVEVNHMLEYVEDQERAEVLSWLSSVNYVNNHSQARKDHVAQTGAWLLEHKAFRQWHESSGSTCLWLKGNAGTGKTKLASTVIEALKKARRNAENSTEAFAYFYCNRDEPQRRSPEIIMSTLVKQLTSLHPGGPLHKAVIQEYKQRKMENGHSCMLDLMDSHKLAKILCDSYPQSLIVVDALDEIDQASRDEILDALHKLATQSSSLVKIFVTSRLDEDIVTALRGIPTIELASHEEHGDDMKLIIEHKVTEAIEKLGDKVNSGEFPKFRSQMTGILLKRAEGMPLWISHQINNICKTNRRTLQTPQQILKALESFPTSLTGTYDHLLKDMLQDLENESNKVGICAFQWIMAAIRPLSPDELLGAIDPDGKFQLQHILDICSNLLVHDEKQDVIRFYHLSVREYLETQQNHFDMDKVRPTIIETPFTIFTQPGISSYFATANIRQRALMSYIARNWIAHFPQDSQSEILLTFFRNRATFTEWEQMVYYSDLVHTRYGDKIHDMVWDLQCIVIHDRSFISAISWGLYQIVMVLIQEGADPASQNALETAARRGDMRIVGFLVEKGANADNAEALRYAAHNGHEQIVRFLVEKGANVENAGALEYAVSFGHEQIVRFLVEKGANAYNAKTLEHAAWDGHEQIVRFLVEKGANADNAEALKHAAWSGHEQIVRFLVEKGANADNAEALKHAAEHGHEQIVRFLVEKGANADNAEALKHAAEHGHEQIVRFLVEKGADADAGLHYAAVNRHEQIVRFLVEKGANANYALGYAVGDGREQFVRFLVEKGANVEFAGALEYAVSSGHEQIVRFLVEKGANADNVEALRYAASLGHEQIVRFLVEKGANADNAEALKYATWRGHEQIVRFLVEKGANANNALEYAVRRGDEQIVRFLVEKGANADNVKALRYAASLGHEQIVRFLVEKGANPDNAEALKYATWGGHEQIVKFRTEARAKANSSSTHGE